MLPITNNDGLLTIGNTNTCLGYLMNFKGQWFEPSHGKVDVTDDMAQKHNQVLSQAELKGLDENCQIGQMGSFYYTEGKGVHTWIGDTICPNPSVTNTQIVFTRNGKTFRGKRRKNEDMFTFTRIK